MFKFPLEQILEVGEQNFRHKSKEKVTKEDEKLERTGDRVQGLSGCNINTSEDDVSDEGQESQLKQMIGLVKCDSFSLHKQNAPGLDVADLLDKDVKSKRMVLDVMELVAGTKDKGVNPVDKEKFGGETLLGLSKGSMALGENASGSDMGKESQQSSGGGKDNAHGDESWGEGYVIPNAVLVDEMQSSCVTQSLVENVMSQPIELASNAVGNGFVASPLWEDPGDNHPSEMDSEDQGAGFSGFTVNPISRITEAQRIPDTRYNSRVQDQLVKKIQDQQVPILKKRPREGNTKILLLF
jgi:hypothetical protein